MTTKDELESIFCQKRDYDFQETMNMLADFARTKRVCIRITTSRDGTEVDVEPYEPYHPTSPYAHERHATEDDGK